MVVDRPFLENGAEQIDTALVNIGLCHLKCVLKFVYGLKWPVSISTNIIEYSDPLARNQSHCYSFSFGYSHFLKEGAMY